MSTLIINSPFITNVVVFVVYNLQLLILCLVSIFIVI